MPSASPIPLTVGTAGHIDHGKTALVEALTGKNTDRLAEERQRGISIELGFAPLTLPGGRSLSVVDVPGHDQLVRTMISGATGIDLFLLVVAADDGVMPQTREHLAVLSALGIRDGIVALTRCDLADEVSIELALEEVRDLLPDTQVVSVSAPTGRGLGELRVALATAADRIEAQQRDSTGTGWPGPAMLHVDRAFSLHGIGTVVTGTLRGASIRTGETIEIVSRGTDARVRSLQVHDEPVDEAMPAQRVAMNLVGVSRGEVGRGDVIAPPRSGLRPSYRLDIELGAEAVAESLDGQRVQVHHGTRDAPAKLAYLDPAGRFAQLRLGSPLIAAAGDRVVIRQIAPADTVGGGEVIDPVPARHGPGKATDRLRLLCEGNPHEVLAMALTEGPVPTEPDRWRLNSALAPALKRHPRDAWVAGVRKLQDEGMVIVRDGAMMLPSSEPVASGPAEEEPTTLDDDDLAVLGLIRADGFAPRSSKALAEALGIEREAADARLSRLARAGAARFVRPDLYYEPVAFERLRERVIELAAERQGSISLAELRDALSTSRKYAQALLEHLDNEKVMVRRGERHYLRKGVQADVGVSMGRQGSGGLTGLQSQ